MSIKIVDISEYQSEVDYAQLKKEVDYVIIRSSYGTIKFDKRLEQHLNGVIAQGIPYGLYHYALYEGGQDTLNEANMLIQAYNRAKIKGQAPTFVFVDVEEKHCTDIVGETNRFIDAVWKGTHCNIGMYAGNAFDAANRLDQVGTCVRWIARYGQNDGQIPPDKYRPTVLYNLWQYTSNGRISSIDGVVDLSTCTSDVLEAIRSGKCPTTSKHPNSPQQEGQFVYFPSGKGKWSVYPCNKPVKKRYAIAQINPDQFGGLTYKVLKDCGSWVYEIQTGFGRVKIYCAPETGAQVSWHGSNGWPNVQ